MSAPKWKHRPCPCGCGEMADECMNPASNPLNAFHTTQSAPTPRRYTPTPAVLASQWLDTQERHTRDGRHWRDAAELARIDHEDRRNAAKRWAR